jgi:hypothetical protein
MGKVYNFYPMVDWNEVEKNMIHQNEDSKIKLKQKNAIRFANKYILELECVYLPIE